MLATMRTTTNPNPNGLTRWKKQAVRYQFLRQLMIWVKAQEKQTGLGTPNIRGFHEICGGRKRISWTRFYNDHFLRLVDEGFIKYSPDQQANVCALVVTHKAWNEVEI